MNLWHLFAVRKCANEEDILAKHKELCGNSMYNIN